MHIVLLAPSSKMPFCQFIPLQIALNSVIFCYVSNKRMAGEYKHFVQKAAAIIPSVCFCLQIDHTLEDIYNCSIFTQGKISFLHLQEYL